MKWRKSGEYIAVSDCGTYEVRKSVDKFRGEFFNAWHLPTGKHVEASHQRRIVAEACRMHAAAHVVPA